MLIGDQWVASTAGTTTYSIDPSTGERLAELAEGCAEDIDMAVQAASKALSGPWSKFKPFDRQQVLIRLADLVDANYEEIARLESLDYGGAISRTVSRKRRHVGLLRYYAGLSISIQGDTIENSIPGEFFTYTLREPVGVVGAIFAWNAPLDFLIWKVAPALATGCTVVVKPATEASLTALRIGELLLQAGCPPGVVNIVPGGIAAGEALVTHPKVNKISFTGSTAAGQAIARASTGTMKRLSLELGGKSPDIVFDDADLNSAVSGAAMGVFGNSGQSCAAGTRVFVQRNVYEEFQARMVAFAKGLKVGDSLDPRSDLGPLISERQRQRVLHYMRLGSEEGARLLAGGSAIHSSALPGGFFVEPTIFSDVTDEMTISREEIFGPVMSILPFDDLDEVIARGNRSEFGLAGGVWTRDLNRAHKVARHLCAGSIWVNCYTQLDPAVPFGGYKMSGYGRESGMRHLDDFLEVKSVTIKMG